MRILLVVAALACWVSFPGRVAAETLDCVFVNAVPSASIAFKEMSAEAQEVLSRVGLRARFRTSEAASSQSGQFILLVLLPKPQGSLQETTLGAVTTTDRTSAWLYLEPLARTLGLDPRRPRAWTSVERVRFARALGRVASHEVIHLLLPSLPHSRSGLMGAQVGRNDLVQGEASLGTSVGEALSDRAEAASLPKRNHPLSNPLEVVPF
jgi:hypothetical protein